MSAAVRTLRFGTRGSDLALWQTRHAMALMQAALPNVQVEYEIIRRAAIRCWIRRCRWWAGKACSPSNLEAALREHRIDCAVHSLKDLPTEPPAGLVIGAIPERANPADVLVSRRGYTLATLPEGARVGTSSTRRAAQLLHKRPDLRILDIRGNVDTRVRKALAAEGDYDAIALAYAGLERLGRTDVISEVPDFRGHAARARSGGDCRADPRRPALLQALAHIDHRESALAATAERASRRAGRRVFGSGRRARRQTAGSAGGARASARRTGRS
ncbi:MAG: hydroxymethylbilane synthase [Anaerolineae bacterium]